MTGVAVMVGGETIVAEEMGATIAVEVMIDAAAEDMTTTGVETEEAVVMITDVDLVDIITHQDDPAIHVLRKCAQIMLTANQ